MLTFAKSIGHFAMCFGRQVHQVLYLSNEEPRGTSGRFLAMTRVLFHIHVGTLYAKDIFREKWDVLAFTKWSVHFTTCFEGQVHQALYLSSGEQGSLSYWN